MLKFFRSLFDEPHATPDPHLPELAAAALMLEVAWADHDITADELNLLSAQLKAVFTLTEKEVEAFLEEAVQAHEASVGLHPYTQVLNSELDSEAKNSIVLALWRIALADEVITPLEEHTIRRIADLLYVSHRDFIAAKQKARSD